MNGFFIESTPSGDSRSQAITGPPPRVSSMVGRAFRIVKKSEPNLFVEWSRRHSPRNGTTSPGA